MSTDNLHIHHLTQYRESGWKLVHPEDIGMIVVNNIHKQPTFEVRGVTSKGIFIETDQYHVLFLSKEKFRGPFTLNCRRNFKSLELIALGDTGYVDDALSMVFPKTHHVIVAGSGAIYKPTEFPLLRLGRKEQFQLLLALIPEFTHITSVKESHFLQLMISIIPTLDEELQYPDELSTNIRKLITGTRDLDNKMISESVQYFCGRGLGLTPSGDDFLLGFLYVVNCSQIIPKAMVDNLAVIVLDIARNRTTQLSYQLIQAAYMGQVDERLYKMALVLTGNTSDHINTAIADIATWGNSSGLDTTAGMLAALSLYR